MKEVVIASACRTAIGTFGGTLKDSHAATIAAVTMKAAVERAGIDPALIDDIRYGCCMEPVDSLNVTRIAALLAGIPESVTAVTINRVCISGMEAVISGMAMIQAGMADVILAGGVEHMSGVPYSVPGARWGCRLQDNEFVDNIIRGLYCGSHVIPHPEDGPVDAEVPPLSYFKGKPYIMGHTAEFIAQHLDISREEMDEVALRSHNNVERATKDGSFEDEIVPMEIPQRKGEPLVFKHDEHFRPGMTMEKLQALPPAFVPKIGKVTAGNSSGINDGAAALLLMSAEKARELNLKPMARWVGSAVAGVDPGVMGYGPVPATRKLLKRLNLTMDDIGLVELNEAFAAQSLGVMRQLGLDPEITNVNGGAVALGHPLGCSGARILTTLLHEMKRRAPGESRPYYGLASLCVGVGQGVSTVVQWLD